MATFRNRHGKWQARVLRKGQQPVSKSFKNKEHAQRWARQVETEIDKDSYANQVLAEKSLVKDVITRYIEEVTLKTRSMREDAYRLKGLARRIVGAAKLNYLEQSQCSELALKGGSM